MQGAEQIPASKNKPNDNDVFFYKENTIKNKLWKIIDRYIILILSIFTDIIPTNKEPTIIPIDWTELSELYIKTLWLKSLERIGKTTGREPQISKFHKKEAIITLNNGRFPHKNFNELDMCWIDLPKLIGIWGLAAVIFFIEASIPPIRRNIIAITINVTLLFPVSTTKLEANVPKI